MKYVANRISLFTIMTIILMWIPPFISLSTIPHFDKILHILIYATLTYVFSTTFSIRKSVLIVLVLSVILELSQYFLPYRSVQFSDAVSNLIGILSIWFFYSIRTFFNNLLSGERQC